MIATNNKMQFDIKTAETENGFAGVWKEERLTLLVDVNVGVVKGRSVQDFHCSGPCWFVQYNCVVACNQLLSGKKRKKFGQSL